MERQESPISLDVVDDLFNSGNYTAVISQANDGCWQKYAALGLIGKTDSALSGLERFDDEKARFYTAVTNWMDGSEDVAIRILEKMHFPHAQNLIRLIKKPKINVLAQMDVGGWWDLASTAMAEGRFQINNIGFARGDMCNMPYANIHEFYDAANPPDFYISKMLEWHYLIPNLRELPCPVFGHTADYDVHIQAVYPWLRIFDELIVEKDWDDIYKLASIPVSTFPKAYGLIQKWPSIPSGQREFDLFSSGTINHPYLPEKADITYRVLAMEDVNSLNIVGFMYDERYMNYLGNSKVVVAFVRHPGIPTRGLEALAMGAVVILQRHSALLNYVNESEGVVVVDDENELEQTIRKVLQHWPVYEQYARRGAEIVRNEFNRSKVASQYFRFLTFLASKPREQRIEKKFGKVIQKRSVLMKGWRNSPAVYQKIRQHNIERCAELFKQEMDAMHLIDMARECVLEYATWKIPAAARGYESFLKGVFSPDPALLEMATKIYEMGLKYVPFSLVLRFNYIRMMLHFGQPHTVDYALKLALDTLRQPLGVWQIDPLDDVFPYDFFGQFFNYRAYLDKVVRIKQGDEGHDDLIRLILASLNYYVSRYARTLEFAHNAVKYDSNFPFYKLHLAMRLIDEGQQYAIKDACELLVQLANNTMLSLQASALLEHLLANDKASINSDLATVVSKMEKIRSRMHITEEEKMESEMADDSLLMPSENGLDAQLCHMNS